jgi:hypothetical protein
MKNLVILDLSYQAIKFLPDQIESLENLEKLYLSGVISVRFRNYVCKELSLFLEDLNPKDYLSYTLKDLFRIEKKKVLRFRNSGKKNMLEFEELKEKYLTKS